jgi:DNA-binding NarL/FixJ family response regulator
MAEEIYQRADEGDKDNDDHPGCSVPAQHPAIARKVLNRFVPTPGKPARQKPPEVLSERELDVLKLATGGLSNQDIADKLCLSLRTVQAHFSHIFNKLQVSSRTEAVVRALKEGWVTLDDVP